MAKDKVGVEFMQLKIKIGKLGVEFMQLKIKIGKLGPNDLKIV